jgi:hypothetical protein
MGLPGETPEDVEITRRWVASLRGERVLVFPMLLAPLSAGARPMTGADMTAGHWRLFQECYEFNFRWVPKLIWQEQTHARVPLWRRLAIALMGRGNVLWWKILFAIKS